MRRLGNVRKRRLSRRFHREVNRLVDAGVDDVTAAIQARDNVISANSFEDRPILRLIMEFLTILLRDLLTDLLDGTNE